MASNYQKPVNAITDVTPLFQYILNSPEHNTLFHPTELNRTPAAQFYDMDLYDEHLTHCKTAFGPTFQHYIAIKSNSLTRMLEHAHRKHDFGIECASMGEVLHALNHCKIPADRILFDSPCKTQPELEFAIRHKIHINIDNFDEFNRAKAFIEANPAVELGEIGFRVNPLVGAGSIAALSVSTSESKFAVPISEKEKLLRLYKENPWLNSCHVHVGSGGMGCQILAGGIRVAVDLAKEVNAQAGRKQVIVVDIGGGLPANYHSDTFSNPEKNVPDWSEYAEHLRRDIPELFSGEFRIATEFGQSMNAKCGFWASKVEWMKGTEEAPIAIVHFGSSECVRQGYTPDHPRRMQAYDASGKVFAADCEKKITSVGGPLCFQGDFLAKKVELPAALKSGDFMIMKDGGANTYSIFSRHCSRTAPAVFGYRWADAERTQIKGLTVIKEQETFEDVSRFWGPALGQEL